MPGILCFVDLHPYTILQINPTRCTVLLSIFISLLYMFRASVYPSPGEITASVRHWYLSLCIDGVWSAGWSETPTSRTDAIHTKWQIPVSHTYSNFSCWWAHGYPKHVEKRNKYTKQNSTPSWICLQDMSGKSVDLKWVAAIQRSIFAKYFSPRKLFRDLRSSYMPRVVLSLHPNIRCCFQILAGSNCVCRLQWEVCVKLV